jgi:hypothetical protein
MLLMIIEIAFVTPTRLYAPDHVVRIAIQPHRCAVRPILSAEASAPVVNIAQKRCGVVALP